MNNFYRENLWVWLEVCILEGLPNVHFGFDCAGGVKEMPGPPIMFTHDPEKELYGWHLQSILNCIKRKEEEMVEEKGLVKVKKFDSRKWIVGDKITVTANCDDMTVQIGAKWINFSLLVTRSEANEVRKVLDEALEFLAADEINRKYARKEVE